MRLEKILLFKYPTLPQFNCLNQVSSFAIAQELIYLIKNLVYNFIKTLVLQNPTIHCQWILIVSATTGKSTNNLTVNSLRKQQSFTFSIESCISEQGNIVQSRKEKCGQRMDIIKQKFRKMALHYKDFKHMGWKKKCSKYHLKE